MDPSIFFHGFRVRFTWGFVRGEQIPEWLLQEPAISRCDDVACSSPEKRHRRDPPKDSAVTGWHAGKDFFVWFVLPQQPERLGVLPFGVVWGSRPKPCTRFREVPKEWNRFRSEGSIHETLGSEKFRSEGSIHETLGSERFRSEGSIHETLGSERFRSEGSIHETLGSERFRSQGSIHETLGSERFRSQGSIHETLGSERFRSEGSIHETLGSERFRSEGSVHETLGSKRFLSEGSIHET